MKNFTISVEQIDDFKKQLKAIENWKGDAYQQNDEVDIGMRNIKTILSMIVHGKSTEVCPHCDTEQKITKSLQPCKKCKKPLVGCSMCSNGGRDDKFGCADCPDGTDTNYDVSLDDI